MKAKFLFKTLTIVSPIFVATGFVTSCNKGSNPVDPTPPGPTPVGPDPEPEPTIEKAEDYIKDRTFAICGFKWDSGQSKWTSTGAGTGWILSDSTPTITTDYNYYIATNWHVKYPIDDEGGSTRLGYWVDGMTQGKYVAFNSFTWENKNNFCHTANDTTTAIDFYIVNVNFGIASELESYAPTVKTKLDKLNAKQANVGRINRFLESTRSLSYGTYPFYCGGYPTKNGYQTWKFISLKAKSTTYIDKGSDPTKCHGIDSTTNPTIIDISSQYQTNKDNLIECDSISHEPINWDLTAGSSGSMLITSHNNEWWVVGIYWGGIIYTISQKEYFSPCWSVFRSDKDFTTPYI